MRSKNLQHIIEYIKERCPVNCAVNLEWLLETLDMVQVADERKIEINSEWLRAEFEISFDGKIHSKAPFVQL